MPKYGEKQKSAGKGLAHTCELCEPVEATTMRVKSKGFKVVPPPYKGNAVLNANK